MARPAGGVDKRSKALEESIRRRFPNYDPIVRLIELADRAKASDEMQVELNCHKEVAGYLLPKLKAIEHSLDEDTTKRIGQILYPTAQVMPNHVRAADVGPNSRSDTDT